MNRCRSCSRSTLVEVTNLGQLCVPDFRADTKEPPRYPLRLVRCVACGLVQLDTTTPRTELYHDGYGFYSGVNERTRAELETIVLDTLQRQAIVGDRLRWLDIGCNDGTLLSFVPERHWRAGIDPVPKLAALADQHADEIHVELFDPDLFDTEFDVVTSIAMFYDLDDPDGFVEDVQTILSDNGLWVVQQNDLLSMMDANAIDNVSHEHLTYWSLTAFRDLVHRHGLEVQDVIESDLNGGCMRCFVRRRDYAIEPHRRVEQWLQRERAHGVDQSETYSDFAARSFQTLAELTNVIQSIVEAGDRVFVYGASNRGSTLWQAAGIQNLITCAVERNPDKVGLRFSSVGCPIISEDEMRRNPPEYLLIGPWWFADMFVEREAEYLKSGGALIVPLPEVRVITA